MPENLIPKRTDATEPRTPLADRLARLGTPRMEERLHVSVTLRCNQNCIFCLDDDQKLQMGTFERLKYALEETDLEAFKERIRPYVSITPDITFTFGEPTSNTKLPLFVRAAREEGFKEIAVITNGRMLRYPEYALTLIDSGVTHFHVSVHGYDQKSNDAHTRTRGAFHDTDKALHVLSALRRARSFRLDTSGVITSVNLPHIAKLLRYMMGFTPSTIILNPTIPRGFAKNQFDRLMPTYAEMGRRLGEAIAEAEPDLHAAGIELAVIEDIPRCLCAGFEKYLALKEAVHMDSTAARTRTRTTVLMRMGEGKRKHPGLCGSCRIESQCPGVFEEYVNRRGWSEIQPVK